jgi:hypothetical protein
MKRKTKIAIGAAVASAHFVSYLGCISSVVANDANGDANSTLLSFVTPTLGWPFMKLSAIVVHLCSALGMSDRGLFIGQLCLAALNSLLWAMVIVWCVGALSVCAKEPNQPAEPMPLKRHGSS